VGHIERREFGETQTAAVKKLQDRSVAQRHPGRRGLFFRDAQWRAEKFVDLLLGQNQRQLLFRFRQLELAHGVEPKMFSLDEKSVESAERGELEADVRPRLAVLHQLKEIVAEIVRAAFLPEANIF